MRGLGFYRHALFIALFAAILACAPATTAQAAETETIPLVMVVVGFDGGDNPTAVVPYDDAIDWGDALFGPGESPAAYFRDLSNGAFTFVPANETSATGVADNTNDADRPNDGVVHVTLHRQHGSWGAVNVDSAVTADFSLAVLEALDAAGAFIDFASYDADGDGELSAKELSICLCIAGYEAASIEDFRRDDIPLLWSHSGLLSVIDNNNRSVGAVRFDGYIAIAELYWTEGDPLEAAEPEPLGVVYHELGHALGLPDLYAVDIADGPWEGYTVGPLSLMDTGGWQYADDGAGWRNIPTALDAWSRYVLGWTTPTVVASSGDYLVSSQLSAAGYSQLVIPTTDPNEYFLVENRQPEGHDISLAEDFGGDSGVLVWHVDNGMYRQYYDANQINDANHRPGVMCDYLNGETELLLYDDADDTPDACIESGISLWLGSDTGRDMTVHVEFGGNSASNVVHLLDDEARDQLGMTQQGVLEEAVWLTRALCKPFPT